MVKAVILKNELSNDHLLWVKACEEFKSSVSYRVVDLTKNNWLEEIQKMSFDILLAKPGAFTTSMKQLYDERVNILVNELHCKLFPSLNEILIYENKRYLAYWLKANKIPHPTSFVFYNREEAKEFLDKSNFPLVAKTNIGASGTGVSILKTASEAIAYADNVFDGKGATRRTGPNLKKGGLLKRGFNYVLNPSRIKNKLEFYKSLSNDVQKDFVIFQSYIEHDFEWRVVRIGDSFFAHKKLKLGEKASGSLLKNYDNPPLSLLDFVKEITDKHNMFSQAVDVFETNGNYLVNEMQCIFGQSDPYQMKVNDIVGRYVYNHGWLFEAGDFNTNECYNLRLEYVINFLSNEGTIRK